MIKVIWLLLVACAFVSLFDEYVQGTELPVPPKNGTIIAEGVCTYKVAKYDCFLIKSDDGDFIVIDTKESEVVAIYYLSKVNGKVHPIPIYEWGTEI